MTTSPSPTIDAQLPAVHLGRAAGGPLLADVLDQDLLAEMVTGGYVRVQVHPSLPYVIHNYGEDTA